ncbi:methyl-accepting chemotaxis protein [Histidinibacterium aquaticum]|uniref:HAMP domain-containing protein n=1 Tax=Histidinibacterium aquaticum TaxID=2613962 RepID=A0A5J5GIL6_9RHOB|nr:methyl-accepting chemotaxis protein [Histidinibacterium aquaticum]KAA9007967.1 HAMP domain-containing protein [Histidinibacterium aquaticum]
MRKFDSINLSKKLPITLVGLSLTVALATAVIAFLDFRATLLRQAEVALEEVKRARADTLEDWFGQIENDLARLAANPQTGSILAGFDSSFDQMDNARTELQRLYVSENPNSEADRARMTAAEDGSSYSAVHRLYHPYFRNVASRTGYADIFMIDPDGTVIYSVNKRQDFVADLVTGAQSDSGLAEVFTSARDAQAGTVRFSDFEPYAATGEPAGFVATPVVSDTGDLRGVLAVRLSNSRLNGVIQSASALGESVEVFLVGPDGRSRAASRLGTVEAIYQPLPELPQIAAARAGETRSIEGPGLGGSEVMSQVAAVDVFGDRWGIVTEMNMDEVLAPVRSVQAKLVILLVSSAVLVAIFAAWISRTINLPLTKVRDAIRGVAEGNYDINLRALDRGDEIGHIARTVLDLAEKLRRSDAAEQERLERQREQRKVVERLGVSLTSLAEGDLTSQIEEPFPDDYEALRTDFNKALINLRTTIETVVENATRIGTGTGEISSASDDLSRRTESQAATLEETAAALDELTQSVNSAAQGAKEVEGIVTSAKSHAEESGAVVQSAVNAMTEIEKSSDQIGQIIGVIDDIAFQTNLLALNAGVEAARAGEAGKGFAVVASEVRALAQRSSEAAREIKDLISGSSHQVEQGVALVGRAGEALTSIVERVTHISELVTNIARGTVEQAQGLSEINTGVTNLDQVTQQNAAMVEQSTAAAHSLSREASDLAELVRRFRIGAETPAPDRPARRRPEPQRSSVQSVEPLPAPQATGTDGIWQDF